MEERGSKVMESLEVALCGRESRVAYLTRDGTFQEG